MTNREMVIREPTPDMQDFALPTQERVTEDLKAIHAFQTLLQGQLKEGHDYGVIPGTGNKPTLLKPGAEKITKLLGLAEKYDLEATTEDWDKPLFRYLIRCRLVAIRTGQEITQGLGECNSMEAKYRWRWAFQSQLPPGLAHSQLVSRSIRTRNGLAKQYRLDNEDIYSQVNTILKMAKKRALVDAALSVGRLSDLFTQDLEEIREQAPAADEPTPTPSPEAHLRQDSGGQAQDAKPEPPEATDVALTAPANVGELLTRAVKELGYQDRAAVFATLNIQSAVELTGLNKLAWAWNSLTSHAPKKGAAI